MFTTLTESWSSANLPMYLGIASDLESNPGDVEFDIAYNRGEPALLQRVQVGIQKSQDITSLHFIWLANLDIAPDWFSDAMIDIARSSIGVILDAGVIRQVSSYHA